MADLQQYVPLDVKYNIPGEKPVCVKLDNFHYILFGHNVPNAIGYVYCMWRLGDNIKSMGQLESEKELREGKRQA